MRTDDVAGAAQPGAPSASLPSFGEALGRRLRQLREDGGATAAEVADLASLYGLSWDRSTLSRIELGQRQVSAVELLLLPVLYGRPLTELLPDEPCRMTDDVTAAPDVLRRALTEVPQGYDTPRLWAGAAAGLERLQQAAAGTGQRFPGVRNALRVARGASHAKDEAVVKAARRLDAHPWDIAVAAEQLWHQDLTAERDERVGQGPGGPRARQARRGHVTRRLLEELAPVVARIQTARTEGES